MEKLKIGITQGDFNGVGYETILKVLSDSRLSDLCTPILFGSAKIAAYYKKNCDLPEARLTQITSPAEATDDLFYIVNVTPEDAQVTPGEPTPDSGLQAVNALRAAVTALRNGEIDAMVTAPIDKENVKSADFPFTGHTEFLDSELQPGHALMMMCHGDLRVALASIHIPVRDVAQSLSAASVLQSLTDLNSSLIRDFAIHHPRIAVLSLNPHAGDGGLIGTEDGEIITPAIRQASENGIAAFGPYPADGLFGSGNYRKFDAILAMYHDQGLIPFKLLAQNQGVNFTAGLSAVRTSPDHGTAFDIAGKGVADEQSLRNAIYLAIDIVRNRLRQDQATANPLPPSPPRPESRRQRQDN